MIPIGKTAFIGFIVAAATCLGMSASGSEKNDKTLTAVESLMRSDTRIMELDGMLNHSYRAAMRAVADRKTLKQAQIAWLRTVRNPCKTTDCLEDVYCDRINELHDLEIEALGVIDKPLNDDEVKSIYRTLAKLADKGKLSLMAVPGKAFSRLDQADKRAGWEIDPVKLKKMDNYYDYIDLEYSELDEVFKIRLNPKSEPVIFGKFWNSGSCPSANVFDLSTNVDLLIAQETKDAESTAAQNEENPEETAESFEGDDGTEASHVHLFRVKTGVVFRVLDCSAFTTHRHEDVIRRKNTPAIPYVPVGGHPSFKISETLPVEHFQPERIAASVPSLLDPFPLFIN